MPAQSKTKSNLKLVIACLLGIAVVYFLVNLLVATRFQELELQTRVLVSEQETVLTTIAETTARNGADSVTEAIIQDCSLAERASFDTLLNELDRGMSHAELTKLERLFGRCGGFYAERKAIMTSQLVREIAVYETYVKQLSLIMHKNVDAEFQIKQWNELAQEEQKQSKLFSQLVSKQDDIINTLLAGKSAESAEIATILREVTEIQETLIVTSKQIAKTRADLISF